MISRRTFLSNSFSTISSFAIGGALTTLSSRLALGGMHLSQQLKPVKDETTGLELLRLPEGFRYQSYGWTGDLMSDGTPTPAEHDGMGLIAEDGDQLTLIRNHEISGDGPHIPHGDGTPYDPMAGGGCSTLVFDTKQEKFVSSKVSFSGSSRNCAGGITPWGTWLTCEETAFGPKSIDIFRDNKVCEFQRTHGWIFEVDPTGSRSPEPLRDMGRFVHEAVAVDRETGIIYETEDRETAGFYRFIPNKNGQLSAGGTLEMAEVIGQPDCRGSYPPGTEFDVKWHKIHSPGMANSPSNPKPDELGVFRQGKSAGGSTFGRLEGCWFGDCYLYFDATSGGDQEAGQIWRYDPSEQKLRLVFESPAKHVLNMPDNFCVNPRGGLLLCEDNDYGANEYPQRIFSLNQEGKLRLFAENNIVLDEKKGTKNGFQGDFRTKEWCGANYCPSGKWLFVNNQTPGITFAITGPWESIL